MKYRFIEVQREQHGVRRLCDALSVSPSGYYAWRSRCESARRRRHRALTAQIREVHADSGETYGSPRVHAELKSRGERCGENTVALLMRRARIVPKSVRKFRVTTDSRKTKPVPNLLEQDFAAPGPNERWAGDITFVPTREGWLYVAVILDLYSRAVVGWAMSRRLNQALTIDALKMALVRRRIGTGLLLHSDQGSQYAAADYQAMLAERGIVCSMSRKGNCWDNACVESFFGTLKTELVHHEDYRTRAQARASLFHYIEVFYNRQRRHSYLGYATPLAYESTMSP